MLNFLNENLGQVAGILGSIIAIAAGVRFGSKYFLRAIRAIRDFFGGPRMIKDFQSEYRIETSKRNDSQDAMLHLLTKINYALYNDGKNGALHQIGRLAAAYDISFENEPRPQFECTVTGENTLVNQAYRTLVEVWSSQEVNSLSWLGATYGDHKDSYLAEFQECAKHGIDFMGMVDFRNPHTGEHRGRWRIQARAKIVGDMCIYFGTFVEACDLRAAEIVVENFWGVRVMPSGEQR